METDAPRMCALLVGLQAHRTSGVCAIREREDSMYEGTECGSLTRR